MSKLIKTNTDIKEYVEIIEFCLDNSEEMGLDNSLCSRMNVTLNWLKYILGEASSSETRNIEGFLNSVRKFKSYVEAV